MERRHFAVIALTSGALACAAPAFAAPASSGAAAATTAPPAAKSAPAKASVRKNPQAPPKGDDVTYIVIEKPGA